jgi:uncharacterized protein (TIGR00725 family)
VTLFLEPTQGQLFDSSGRVFEPKSRTWRASDESVGGGEEIPLCDAVTWLQRSSGAACRVPVGVIGAREARPDQLTAAEDLGRRLAEIGLTVLCGGRQGIMEAVCRGVAANGGVSVGILPDDDPKAANPYVTIPIATGIGIARNALVARAALCLIAIGGGYGTISEAAFGLQFTKPVFTLLDGPSITGTTPCGSVAEALDGIARIVLGLPL